MGNLTFMFAAYAVVWVAVLLYSFSIAARHRSLEREIEMLKAALAERQQVDG